MSLRARLLIAAGLLVVVLVGIGVALMRTVESSQLRQVDDQLNAAFPIAAGLARNNGGTAPGTAPRTTPRPPDRRYQLSDDYVAVITKGKRTTISSPQSAKGAIPAVPPVESFRAGLGLPFSARTVGSVHGSGRWRAVALADPDGSDVVVAVYMGPTDATASELRDALLAAAGFVALILVASAFWLERLGLRPITETRKVAEAIAAGDRSRRVPATPSGGEAQRLSEAFNAMLDKQNDIEDQLRQFVADASHELRTPTAVISGLAQLWRQGDLRDGEALEDAMHRIGQESSRMRGLVEELLLLARLDEGAGMSSEPVDVGDVVTSVLEDAESTNPSRSIEARVAPGAVVEGDQVALRRVVSNLVTNALIHTPAASPITVKVEQIGPMVVLEVGDAGPGMEPATSDHAFDRFWRAESSRTRSGSGLGLPIAQAVVTAHGGTIELQTSPRAGTTVWVRLPAAAGGPAGPVGPVGLSAAAAGSA